MYWRTANLQYTNTQHTNTQYINAFKGIGALFGYAWLSIIVVGKYDLVHALPAVGVLGRAMHLAPYQKMYSGSVLSPSFATWGLRASKYV